MAKLWDNSSYFKPHGNTDNAVRIAIGYSLPDEQPQAPDGEEYKFKDEKYNQTYLANLSTMVVDSKSKVKIQKLRTGYLIQQKVLMLVMVLIIMIMDIA